MGLTKEEIKECVSWGVIGTDNYLVIFPAPDYKRHGEKVGEDDYDLDSMVCRCQPKVVTRQARHDLDQASELWQEFAKPLVIHNAWCKDQVD